MWPLREQRQFNHDARHAKGKQNTKISKRSEVEIRMLAWTDAPFIPIRLQKDHLISNSKSKHTAKQNLSRPISRRDRTRTDARTTRTSSLFILVSGTSCQSGLMFYKHPFMLQRLCFRTYESPKFLIYVKMSATLSFRNKVYSWPIGLVTLDITKMHKHYSSRSCNSALF
jgi:hypothetical protein